MHRKKPIFVKSTVTINCRNTVITMYSEVEGILQTILKSNFSCLMLWIITTVKSLQFEQ